MIQQINAAEKTFFKDFEKKYSEIPKEKIVQIETVNDLSLICRIKEKKIDIICFLGGDIAKKEIINAAQICCLNYHSGISPFYNRNKTSFHAVKDFRPNFVGGTLMYLTERIDGGRISNRVTY